MLVVHTGFLGDVVLATPLLRELRRRLPAAELCAVVTPTGAEVLRTLPYVDRTLEFDKRRRAGGLRLLRVLRLIGELRRLRPAVAVAAHRSHRTGLLVRASGARLRVGFAGAPGAWAYSERIPWEARAHAVDRYLALAGTLSRGTGAAPDRRPEIGQDPAAAARIGRLLLRHAIGPVADVVAVAPGSVWPTKRWPAARYAELVSALAEGGVRPVLVGGPADRELCERVAEASGGVAPNLAGATTIAELAALTRRARAVVANDSGAGHVAAASGTPVVSIFGPTVPASGYAPFGEAHRVVEHPALACRPCHRHGPRRCPLGHFRCMREIGVGDVLHALDAVRRHTSRSPGIGDAES